MLLEWIGTDASVWNLSSGPVRMSMAGVKALGMPVADFQTQQTAASDGQRLTGWKLQPRAAFLPINFKDAAAGDVEGIQRAWWRSWEIGKYGTLKVTDDLGGIRMLDLRFVDDGGLALPIDPHLWHPTVGMNAMADRPWWYGPAETFAFSLGSTATETFFGNGSGATPFYILPAVGGAAATIENPGDAAAWVEWHLEGPFTAFRLGLDGHYVGGPINVSTEEVVIFTDPLQQYVTRDGVVITRQLTEIDFAPLPPNTTLPVSVEVTGVGTATAIVIPKYARGI